MRRNHGSGRSEVISLIGDQCRALQSPSRKENLRSTMNCLLCCVDAHLHLLGRRRGPT